MEVNVCGGGVCVCVEKEYVWKESLYGERVCMKGEYV